MLRRLATDLFSILNYKLNNNVFFAHINDTDKLKLLILILLPILYTNVGIGIDDRDTNQEDPVWMDPQEYKKYVNDNYCRNGIKPVDTSTVENRKTQLQELSYKYIDSDNDGLTNIDEKAQGSSIFKKDTDGDGLNDTEEEWWACIPTDIDTDDDGYLDGDEIHLEVGDPNKGDGCPYTEESLKNKDKDRDGLPVGAEDHVLKTDSTIKSSDGDKYSDGIEVLGFDFYGLEMMPDYVAHDPHCPGTADIILEMDPQIKLNLATQVKEESKTLGRIEKAFNDEKGFNEAASLNYKVGASSSIESSVGSPSATNPLGVETKAKVEVHSSIDFEAQAGFSASQKWTSEHSELRETLKTEEVDLSDSTLQIWVDVKNIGDDVASEGIDELMLNLYMGDDENPFYTYTYPQNSVMGKNLKPGDHFKVTIEGIPIDYGLFKRLISGEGVRVGVAHYSFGKDQYYLNNARARCVEVNLDDGTGLIRYRVAPSARKITLYDALKLSGISIDLDDNRTIKSVNGREIKSGSPPYKWWTFTILKPFKTKSPEIKDRDQSGDILNVDVYPGDLVLLKYQLDSDGDMLPDTEERLIGTEENKEDTDGDGLWDGDSIPGRNVTGERAFGTNPLLNDTDEDGLNDSIDPNPLDALYVIPDAEPQPVVVYDHKDYKGIAREFWSDSPNLGDFNDKIQSLKVPWGCHVELFDKNDYDKDGRSKIFVKNTSWVGDDFFDKASSMKIKRIELFEHKNYKGKSKTIVEPNVPDLKEFDDKVESLRVPQGYSITLYENRDFTGKDVTYYCDEDWVGMELHDSVSSLRVNLPPVLLASTWNVEEHSSDKKYDGKWIRRSGTNTFDASWKKGSIKDVIDIVAVQGNNISLHRQNNNGNYTGTISPDGNSISGTASWYKPGDHWSASIPSILLAPTWIVKEYDGKYEYDGPYDGKWIRRSGTNTFDASWTGGWKDVIDLKSVQGNNIVLHRHIQNGDYTGTISPDGNSISGTASWYKPGGRWSAHR